MNNNIITKEEKRLVSLFKVIEQLSEMIENIVRTSKSTSKFGMSEQYLTDKEVSKMLKISRRCLQDYRTNGKIPFYRIGGKILYRSGDIEQFLKEHYQDRKTDKYFTSI